MKEIKPQRPARSAAASTPSPCDHNTSSAIEQREEWADDCGVMATTLIEGQWVLSNAPRCSYVDKTLKVLLNKGTVRVVDTRTGGEHMFTGLSPKVAV